MFLVGQPSLLILIMLIALENESKEYEICVLEETVALQMSPPIPLIRGNGLEKHREIGICGRIVEDRVRPV